MRASRYAIDCSGWKKENQQQIAHIAHLTERNTLLTEEVQWLKSQLFGRSSEKSTADVLTRPEECCSTRPRSWPRSRRLMTRPALKASVAHERNAKPGRKAIPEHFPRKQVVHDLPENEKVCPIDGTPLKRIGEEISEQYEYTPPKLIVVQHVRPKYASGCDHAGGKDRPGTACSCCPKSMASPLALGPHNDGKVRRWPAPDPPEQAVSSVWA